MKYDRDGIIYDIYWASTDTFLLELYCPHLTESEPGQFAMVECPGFFLRRPISIFEIDGYRIKFLIRSVGKGTEKLKTLRRGCRLKILGPLGNSFTPHKDKSILLVAGGIGAAPLIFFAKKLEKMGKEFLLIYGENSADKIIRQDLLPNNTVLYTLDGSSNLKGSAITGAIKYFTHQQVFACGPIQMLKELCKKLPDADIWVSMEQRMACGVGACQGCAIETKQGYKLVCSDGPIFRANEIW